MSEQHQFPFLPAGWATAKIEDLIFPSGVFIDGDWVESKDQDPSGDVRLTQLADIGDGKFLNRSSRFLTYEKAQELRCTFLEVGDVLIARMPEPLGRACLFPGDNKKAVTVVDVCIVRTGLGDANHRWLVWAINSPEFRKEIAALQSGVTRRRISRSNLATLFLPVPPLAEQQRIVDEIEKQFSRLDAAVELLRRVERNLERLRAATLKAAVEGRLVPIEAELARAAGRDYEPADALLQRILRERRAKWEADQLAKMKEQGKTPKDDKWKTKYKEPVSPDVSSLSKIPESWIWVTVESLSTKVVDGVHKKPDYVPAGIPFVTVRNLTAGSGISFERLNYITQEDHGEFCKRANPEYGDILISKDGTLGIVRLVQTDIPFSIFVSVALIKPVLKDTSHYFSIALSAPQVQVQMVPKGSGLQHIHLEDLRVDCIPLPPLAEQHRIVAEVERRISVIEELKTLITNTLRRAAVLRQKILREAFAGKLVAQDPADEPASRLLERIRAERDERAAEADKARKGKGKKSGNGQKVGPLSSRRVSGALIVARRFNAGDG